MKLTLNDEVSGAVHFDRPIVALESTVIAHGLPYPKNIETAYKLERIIREQGAVPAPIAVFGGEICVGLNEEHYEKLATGTDIRKCSRRDLPIVVARKQDGATTVAATALIAHRAGIRIFATGGIGGVHRGDRMDISADLPELAATPIIVVCSGAKSLLDLSKTREWLETNGITVLGWQSGELPAFYSRTSGLAVDQRVDKARDVVRIADARNELGFSGAIILTVPVPEKFEIPRDECEQLLKESLKAAADRRVAGRDLTPFLLGEMASRSGGRTLEANIALLENNARVAARIAAEN